MEDEEETQMQGEGSDAPAPRREEMIAFIGDHPYLRVYSPQREEHAVNWLFLCDGGLWLFVCAVLAGIVLASVVL